MQALAILDTNKIKFLGDVNRDGVPDTVRYFTSDSLAAGSTPNPSDVILYRVVNGEITIGTPAGVTDFTLSFLDELGNATTDLMDVRGIRILLTVESLYPYDGKYARVFWEERITPTNLFRRTATDFGP